jgi:glycogen debranching enzyme
LLLLVLTAAAGAQPKVPDSSLVLTTNNVGPARFVAAHGERSLLMGYSGSGLEAWAYPFQLFRNFRVEFLSQGGAAIDGSAILSKIEYHPAEIVRIYVGPDFEVREHLFVPLDLPGVVLTYDVTGRRAVDIKVTLLPVLNLMWPGAIGGQDLNWAPALHGYVISERTTGMRAIIASPQERAHTSVVNSARRQDLTQSMVLHPSQGRAQLFAVLENSAMQQGEQLRSLESNFDALLAEARARTQSVLDSGIQLHTPDVDLDRAFAWSKIAMDQAWVCNDSIGCGEVAGYGPSRPERRPQYAWFFAGDGLVTTEALLAEGDTVRARDELDFIFRYQNPANGMIWHEISQSAKYVDWQEKYPYMFVHVDITFQLLATLADDYEATGDLDFIRAHWDGIQKAWNYCSSLIDPATALPQIPAGKEGGNEQERMREDAGLSASWVAASDAYRRLAIAMGKTSEAEAAARAHDAALKALAGRYWDTRKQFWIAGFAEDGHTMTDERSHFGLLGYGFLAPAQEDAALQRLASADFQTDWGTRGMADSSPQYNPDSYATGSVFALNTADTAEAFWRDHRPAVAWSVWSSLLPSLRLDSLGHLPEVLAGDVFHPQIESVPEQTWSSAGLVHSLVHGIFGLEVDAPHHRLTLEPHLDPRWDHVELQHVQVGAARMDITIEQKPGEIDADISLQGPPVDLRFAPQIPLGASHVSASVNGRTTPVTVEEHEEDEHARIEVDGLQSALQCRILYTGGVRVLVPSSHPELGAASHALKLTSLRLIGHQLVLEADVATAENASLSLETPWKIQSVQGGRITSQQGLWSTLTFTNVSAEQSTYAHMTMKVDFNPQ